MTEDDKRYLEGYVYNAISGYAYVPYIKNNQWYVGAARVSLLQLAVILNINDDEEILRIKLKYGG